VESDVPDGIIAHLMRECDGNLHDRHVVDVTSGSFEKEIHRANPHSVAFGNNPRCDAKNAIDLETYSEFSSGFWRKEYYIRGEKKYEGRRWYNGKNCLWATGWSMVRKHRGAILTGTI
jgi:hypothetical protein